MWKVNLFLASGCGYNHEGAEADFGPVCLFFFFFLESSDSRGFKILRTPLCSQGIRHFQTKAKTAEVVVLSFLHITSSGTLLL